MEGEVWGRVGRIVGTGLLVVTAVFVAANLALAPISGVIQTADDVVWILGALVFSAVGWVIVRRHARHRIGWVFLWIGLFFGLSNAGMGYALLGVDRGLPWDEVAGWVATWTWAPALGLLAVAIAIFPTGRALNRWVGGAATAAATAAAAIAMVNAVVFWEHRSPRLALPDEVAKFDNIAISLISILFPVILLAAVVCLASLVVRFRRASGVERQQLKWLAAAAVVMGPAIVVGQLLDSTGPLSQLVDVLSAPAWLAVAAFRPVRQRVQAAVDLRFNRARIDGLRAGEDFGRRLRDEVDLAAVVADLRSTTVLALQPATVSVVTLATTSGDHS